jgi:transglutaminase-like putative cysteine protease
LGNAASLRAVVAAAPAVAAVTVAWASLEDPVAWRRFAVAGALALSPAAVRPGRWQAAAAALACLVTLGLVFETWPHSAVEAAWDALHDAPAVRAPFDPAEQPALHALVVLCGFALALVTSLAAAARRFAVLAAAVAAGIGFPAVLLDDPHPVRNGAMALAAILWASLVLSVRDPRRGLVGLGVAGLVVAGSGAIAVAGVSPGEGRVDWRGWDPFAGGGRTADLRYVWDANYDGIDFPTRPTTVLTVRSPRRAQYWRVSTLETFTADRWLENLYPIDTGTPRQRLPADPLVPRRDDAPENWLVQRYEVEGLDDAHVPGASQPARIDGPTLGRLLFHQGGVMQARRPLRRGTGYTVWSYSPTPTPRELAASPPRYPAAAGRYLGVGNTRFPGFGARGREAVVDRVFRDDRYRPIWAYRSLWEQARRLTARAGSPYEATLVLERWFRGRGGFRYEEHPPRPAGNNPPLVDFVRVTRAGYCQHYAGAMAVMLRLLGVPARVAVGFTSGTWKAGVWTVTDQHAHAWVEAWFAGYGWLAFDPTPGRGTLSVVYTLASDSADAVRALGTGRFLDFTGTATGAAAPPVSAPALSSDDGRRLSWWVVAALCLPLVAAAAIASAKRLRRARRLRHRDPRRLAAGVRAELLDALLDRGADVERDATPTQLRRAAERVLRLSATDLTEALAEARYGPPARARAAAERARGELHRLAGATRAGERPRERLRAALSLRSLRFWPTPEGTP